MSRSGAPNGSPAANAGPIAVTGATGMVGQHLCDHFRRLGWEVRALARDSSSRPFTEGGIEVFACNLPETVDERALRGARALVHCAYMTRFTSLDEARRVNDLGTRRILELARGAGVESCVFLSSQSAHEGALAYYGRSKLELEKLFAGKADVVLRSGLVLARAGRGLFHRMCDSVRHARVIPLFGGGRQPLQTIHINDLCRAIGEILSRGLSGRFTVAEASPLEMREFLRQIAARLGRRPLFVPFPMRPALYMLRAVEALRLPFPVSSENLLGLMALRAADTRADLEALGIQARSASESLDDVLGPQLAAR